MCVLVLSESSLALNAAGLCMYWGVCERETRVGGQRDKDMKSTCPFFVRLTHGSPSLCESASA